MNRLGGLDGVRGMAVTLVILFHVLPLPFYFGWIGVQIFFVLSGFLITRLLLELRGRPFGSYLKTFYMRRVLRIFPVYYLYLAVVAIVIAIMFASNVALRADLKRVAAQLPYAVTYTYNAFHATSAWTLEPTMAHLWSLAAEEQFYILWPLLVYKLSRRLLGVVVVCLVVAGPILRLAQYWFAVAAPDIFGRPEMAVYVSPVSHIDAFATGAFLAIFAIRGKVTALYLAFAISIAAALGPVFTGISRTTLYVFEMPDGWQFVWGYTVINILSLMLVKGAMEGSLFPRLLNHRWATHVGRVSYGMYLFHYPIATLLMVPLPSLTYLQKVGFAGVVFVVTFIFADLSFRYFESRVLSLKSRYM